LTSEKDDIARFLPRNRLWPPQGEEPLGIRELPEVQLGTAKMRLQAARILHLVDLRLFAYKTKEKAAGFRQR
jgi:hypothetical protein